jgi:hypothetical protein
MCGHYEGVIPVPGTTTDFFCLECAEGNVLTVEASLKKQLEEAQQGSQRAYARGQESLQKRVLKICDSFCLVYAGETFKALSDLREGIKELEVEK